MTEVPEHLLERSRARRAALGLGGDDAPAAAAKPAESTAVEPAAAAAPAPVQPVEVPDVPPPPPPPWVEAAQTRKKVPIWAVPVLAFLPIWAPLYALTLDPPTDEESPLLVGAEAYSTGFACGGCHGGGGGGQGNAPQLNGGAVLETFSSPVDQVHWVYLGSDGWEEEVGPEYGDTGKPVTGGMPGFGEQVEDGSASLEELLTVIRHERETLSGEEFDIELWRDVVPLLEELSPDHAAEAEEILAEWEAEG